MIGGIEGLMVAANSYDPIAGKCIVLVAVKPAAHGKAASEMAARIQNE